MKLKVLFERVELGNSYIMVSMSDTIFKGFLRVNRTCYDIIQCLYEDVTEEQIVNTISTKYNQDPDKIRILVHEIICQLVEANIVQE